MPKLVTWTQQMMKAVHNPPAGADINNVCFANGSQELLTRCFDMLVERGDHVLVETPTYT